MEEIVQDYAQRGDFPLITIVIFLEGREKMELLTSFINSLKTTKLSISQIMFITFIVTCFVTTGCALVKLKKEVKRSLDATSIVGQIHAKCKGTGPIIVAARAKGEQQKIAHYSVLHDSGEYELAVDQGDYYVFAYRDKNSG